MHETECNILPYLLMLKILTMCSFAWLCSRVALHSVLPFYPSIWSALLKNFHLTGRVTFYLSPPPSSKRQSRTSIPLTWKQGVGLRDRDGHTVPHFIACISTYFYSTGLSSALTVFLSVFCTCQFPWADTIIRAAATIRKSHNVQLVIYFCRFSQYYICIDIQDICVLHSQHGSNTE